MKAVLLIAVLLSCAVAERTFYVETKYVTAASGGSGEDFANNLRNDINAASQPSGYCTVNEPAMPFNNQQLCGGPAQNIGFHYYLNWIAGSSNVFDFDMGFDFGWGGALSFNDQWVHIDQTDIWWGGSDFNNGDVWNIRGLTGAGDNTLEIYGSEGCCDGAHDIRWRVNEQAWSSINEWETYESNCCCADNAADVCTCYGEDFDGTSCAELCYGYDSCPEDEQSCLEVTFYQDCYFWGASMQINGDEECLDWEPKSICVPEHKSVTLYNMCNFQGQEVTFTENAYCLDQIDYALLSMNGVTVSGAKKSMKTAEPVRAVIADI